MPGRIPVASTMVLCAGSIKRLGQLRDPDPRVRGFTSQVEVHVLADLDALPSDWRVGCGRRLGASAEGLPSLLGSVRWQAIQRWVREGGHLVLHGTETGWTANDLTVRIDPVR